MTGSVAEIREALLPDLREVQWASPDQSAALWARARALPPGAWTTRLEERVRAHWGALPEGEVGVAVFPAVDAAGGRCEVRVDVVRHAGFDRVAVTDPETRTAVTDALDAARARVVHRDGFGVTFTPAEGWRGGSCGLAVALAALSASMDTPMRRGVWATGRVRTDGRVEAVGEVDRKRADDGRILLTPRANGAGPHAVGTLAEAQAMAVGDVSPAWVAAAARASVAAWLRALGWSEEAHVVTAADRVLARIGPGNDVQAVAIVGAGGVGASWRLARWVSTHPGVVVVVTADGVRDAASLATRAAAAVGWGTGDGVPTLRAVLSRIAQAARALGVPGMLVVDGAVRAAASAVLDAVRGVEGPRVAWSGRFDAGKGTGSLVVACPSVLGDAAWGQLHRHGVPAEARTPIHDAVLGTALGLRAAASVRDALHAGTPVLPATLLRAVLARESQRFGPARLAALRTFLLARAPEEPRALQRVPTELRPVVADALDMGLLVGDRDGRLRVPDTVLRRALAGAATESHTARWVRPSLQGLLSPGPWLACRMRAARQDTVAAQARDEGAPLPVAREWLDGAVLDDALVAPMCGDVAATSWRRWADEARRAIARLDANDPAARDAVVALAACAARACLIVPRVSPEPVRAVTGVARGAAPWVRHAVVGGIVAACVYDTWPVLAYEPGAVGRLLDAASSVLGSCGNRDEDDALRALRLLGTWDAGALRANLATQARPGAMEVAPSWAPVLHVALFPWAWPVPAGASQIQRVRDVVAEAWWARAQGLLAGDGPAAMDARDEADAVAAAMVSDAEVRLDAEALARWGPRAGLQDPSGGGVAEGDVPLRPMRIQPFGTMQREAARAVFVADLTAAGAAG